MCVSGFGNVCERERVSELVNVFKCEFVSVCVREMLNVCLYMSL